MRLRAKIRFRAKTCVTSLSRDIHSDLPKNLYHIAVQSMCNPYDIVDISLTLIPLRIRVLKLIGIARKKKLGRATLRTFALIVYAHPYCARYSCRNAMPRHTLSARAE